MEQSQGGGQLKGRGLLRIVVDSTSGDGRVPIERCVSISREVETLLDAADAMPGAYQLEVSSPGLDRVLGREKDFIAAIDQEVKLRTGRPIEGRKRFRGRLLAVEVPEQGDESSILKLMIDGQEARVPLDEVEKANSIYEFSSADFSNADSKSESHVDRAKGPDRAAARAGRSKSHPKSSKSKSKFTKSGSSQSR